MVTEQHLDALKLHVGASLEAMFGQSLENLEGVQYSEKPPFKSDFMVLLSLAGVEYQAQIVIGLSHECAEELFAGALSLVTGEEAEAMLCSCLGELTNTVAGEMTQSEPLFSQHPDFDLAPPLIWHCRKSTPTFSRSEGISGRMSTAQHEVNLYFSCNALKKVGLKREAKGYVDNLLGDDLDDLLSEL